ncbi:MAG: hypothetical protein NVSMB47_01290 [Polyangiales bacterium]
MATLAAAAVPLFSMRSAQANPRPLPFTYPYGTLPEDSLEVEQYVDVVPLRASETNADGSERRVWDRRYVLQTEIEYGITDHLELGAYLVFAQDPSATDPAMRFDGTKERLRYRFAEAGELPVDVALYLETVELHDELEIEQKVILGKQLGNLSLQANGWIEQEFERGKDALLVYNPTMGLAYRLLPKLHVGVEYWARGRFGHHHDLADAGTAQEVSDFNAATHQFLGPTISLQLGRLWWSVAPYFRLDHTSRSAEVGDQFGKVWVRSVIGLDL